MAGRPVRWHNGGATGFKTCDAFCENPAVAAVVLCDTGSDADAADAGRDFYKMGETLIRRLIEAGKAKT